MAHRHCPPRLEIGEVALDHNLSRLLIFPLQAGNFVREEVLSAFIRLVAHTPELQAYTASKLYLALKSDISQESLTLAATWILGEYSDILLEGGIVDDQSSTPVSTFFESTSFHSLIVPIAPRLGINRPFAFLHGFSIFQLPNSPVPPRRTDKDFRSVDHFPARARPHCGGTGEIYHKP